MVIQVNLRGTSHEIGLQHGRLLRAQILGQVSFYRALFKSRCNLEWPQVLDIAREFRTTITKLVPDLLQEMEGIAEGVADPEVDILVIIALNCRSEITFGHWSDGCTAVGWNVRSGPRKQFLAQNWDWERDVRDNLALMSIEGYGKPRIHMVTEAGIIGKIGFNSKSVGVCLNAIRARPMISSLLPIHVLLRLILESDSVDSAVARLKDVGGCAVSGHMLIADPFGSQGVEISPLGTEIIKEDKEGIVVHTNHFVLNRFVDESSWLDDSPVRLERIRQLCRQIGEKKDVVTPELLRSMFRDKTNPPGSICRQADERGTSRSESLFNIVMELDEGNPRAEVVFEIGVGNEGPPINIPW